MTVKNDPYYTPGWLAAEMASLLPSGTTSVADLAAGGGSLLEAAARRFTADLAVGVADVDARAVRSLRMLHPDWCVSRTNSLAKSSYRLSAAYRQLSGSYDAALLNPPFSYRGGARIEVAYRDIKYKVTPATAFISHALNWVSPGGTIIAIAPQNIMHLASDSDLWQLWSTEMKIDSPRVLGRHTFRSATTTAMILRMARSTRPTRRRLLGSAVARQSSGVASQAGCVCVEIVRGRVPVYRSGMLGDVDNVPFVHTTMLKNGRLRLDSQLVGRELASAGPMILFPRVGMPSRGKVVRSALPVLVLSDCVIGLRTVDPRRKSELYSVLLDDFDDLASNYTGSCAPYITIARLAAWLRLRGFNASHVGPSSTLGSCSCHNLHAETA